jgi:choice-of-anchor B domain-containing protein
VWTNDIWGWTDSDTGHEYAVVGKFEGTAFVDITNPYDPVYLGTLPAVDHGSERNIWGGVKVHGNHAFIVGESDNHGMQVFDLTRLRGVTEPRTWTADNHVGGFGQAHNVAVNSDADRIYVVGARDGVTIPGCENVAGGPIAFDVSDPADPVVEGCYADDGYTHDIQCVNYDGPDTDYAGREICLASNEDTVTILDVTDFANVQQVTRAQYANAAYTHQMWFTEDHAYALLNDEVDELEGTVAGATTYTWDLNDLDNPVLNGTYAHVSTAIDHNIFIKNGLAYQSNYTSGLRITDTDQIDQGQLRERGYFDIYPNNDDPEFFGTWSNYPFFDSGVVVVSSMEEGLFILEPQMTSSEPSSVPSSGTDLEATVRGVIDRLILRLKSLPLNAFAG